MEAIISRVRGIELFRVARYSAVSVIATLTTQVLLVVGRSGLGLDPVVANVAAVSAAALPAFLLNRRWVWELRGGTSLRREVAPFWGFTLAGLALSTAAVALVAAVTTWTPVLMAANLSAFGVLWVAKFFVLDEIVFGAARVDDFVVGTP